LVKGGRKAHKADNINIYGKKREKKEGKGRERERKEKRKVIKMDRKKRRRGYRTDRQRARKRRGDVTSRDKGRKKTCSCYTYCVSSVTHSQISTLPKKKYLLSTALLRHFGRMMT
jgi:hypothetical protein